MLRCGTCLSSSSFILVYPICVSSQCQECINIILFEAFLQMKFGPTRCSQQLTLSFKVLLMLKPHAIDVSEQLVSLQKNKKGCNLLLDIASFCR